MVKDNLNAEQTSVSWIMQTGKEMETVSCFLSCLFKQFRVFIYTCCQNDSSRWWQDNGNLLPQHIIKMPVCVLSARLSFHLCVQREDTWFHAYATIKQWWHTSTDKVKHKFAKWVPRPTERVWGKVRKAGEKTAGLEPIRPGEAPSTCTARPLGRAPVTRWGIIIITIIYLLSRGRLWGQS